MEPDPDDIPVDSSTNQAALLLKQLEALRGELGVLGEELIILLQGAGISTLDEPGSAPVDEAGQ